MSFVKVDSKRLAGLCEATIVACQEARERDLKPFEEKIQAEIASRAVVTRRWFRPSTDRNKVISDLCRGDWNWSFKYGWALEAYNDLEQSAKSLLKASEESDSVYVDTGDFHQLVGS